MFILLQTIVLVQFSLAVTLEFGFGNSVESQPGLLGRALRISYFLALLFLLIASPFFFRSLGKQVGKNWLDRGVCYLDYQPVLSSQSGLPMIPNRLAAVATSWTPEFIGRNKLAQITSPSRLGSGVARPLRTHL